MKSTIAGKIAGLAAGALVLSGCGNIVEAGLNQAGNVAQNQLEGALEEHLELEIDFGENATLPNSYPDSIPEPNGQLVGALGVPDGWSVSYLLDGPDSMDSVIADLVAQGYEVVNEMEQQEATITQLNGDEYLVNIVVVVEEGEAGAQMTVVRTDANDN